MGLKEKWEASRERERQVREANRAWDRRFGKASELQRMGVQALTAAGLVDPALSEETLDSMLVEAKQRQADLFEAFARAGATIYWVLGVQILEGEGKVYSIGVHDPVSRTNSSRLLGPLAGAEAMVTDGTSSFSWGKAAIMPLATAPLARKETADAVIAFPDGTVHTRPLDGSRAVRDARKECVQFNAKANASGRANSMDTGDPAAKLRKLQELLDAGLLSAEEYEAKRAEVINSI